MDVKRVEPSFGMVIKNPRTPQVNTYLKLLPKRTVDQLRKIAQEDKDNKIPVYLTMLMNYRKPKFAVEVGGKRFISGIFQGPVTALKRGVKYARELNAEQESINKAWGNVEITGRGRRLD